MTKTQANTENHWTKDIHFAAVPFFRLEDTEKEKLDKYFKKNFRNTYRRRKRRSKQLNK
jgi:hypothetical protein